MKRVLIVSLLIIGIIYLSVCWYFSTLIITPKRKEIPELSQKFKIAYGIPENFEVKNSEEFLLRGWYFDNPAEGDCGAILVHGWGSSRMGMLKYMPLFWTRGCDIALFDHRAHGDSEGKFGTGGVKESDDVIAINDWFKEKTSLPDSKIAWVGESWGGATVLQAGAKSNSPGFLLVDSPFKSWKAAIEERAFRDYGKWTNVLFPMVYFFVKTRAGVSPPEANTEAIMPDIKIPLFLIHSQTDQATASSQSVAMSESLDPTMSVFHHTDWGSLHVQDVKDHPTKYEKLFLDFLGDQKIKLGKQIEIAYISNKDGFDIYKNNSLGNTETKLTTNPNWDWSPKWSAATQSIIYNSNDENDKFSIQSMSTSGEILEFTTDLSQYIISPNGRQLHSLRKEEISTKSTW